MKAINKTEFRCDYSHCTKFTPGKLDCYPWSQYERREINPEIIQLDDGDFIAQFNGITGSDAETPEEAIMFLCYTLMDNSRKHAMEFIKP